MRMVFCKKLFVRAFALVAILAFHKSSFGQDSTQTNQPQSQPPVFTVETIVVTADRFENKIANATSSISVLRAEDMRRLPLAKFADVFNYLPGFFVVNKDGRGRDAIINSRGFYGGGEAEYLVALLDGRPINDLETGLINWNLVPINDIERVEVVRGSASPLYGDAALGGVVNLMTRKTGASRTELSLDGGALQTLNLGLRTQGAFGKNHYQIFGSHERSRGFRDHSDWRGTTVGGELALPGNASSTLRLSTINQWVKLEDAGPLTPREMAANRQQSSLYYRYDRKDETTHQARLDFSKSFSRRAELKAGLFYRFKDGNQTRTFTNPAPIIDPSTFPVVGIYDTTLFGDTKERVLQTNQVGLNVQYNVLSRWGARQNRLSLGVDADWGRMKNNYHGLRAGFEEDYRTAEVFRRVPLTDGRHRRIKYAFYVNEALQVFESLAVNFGGRFDVIIDRYHGDLPDTTIKTNHQAFSPKVGANFHYADSSAFAGSIYAAISRSFKAPTLDQFSDQRPIDVGFFIPTAPGTFFFLPQTLPPFSNALLKPQKATSYEIGVYQRLKFSGALFGELSVSLYHMNLKDEIDFDLATLKYLNIYQSRHRGVESALRIHWLHPALYSGHGDGAGSPMLMTFFNYTRTDAKFKSGDYTGHYLKAIPRNLFSVGVTYEPVSRLSATVTWQFVRGTFLDDENTVELPNYNTGSMRISCALSKVNVFMEIENLFDQKFSTTGYTLFGETYLYPAAGRMLRGGLRLEF